MRIREYTPADLDALRQMHAAQGFGYPFPDLDSPMFVSKLVLEDDERAAGKRMVPREASRRIMMAAFLRLTAETYCSTIPPRARPPELATISGAPRSRAARCRRPRTGRRAGVSTATNRARFWTPPRAPWMVTRSLALLFPAGPVVDSNHGCTQMNTDKRMRKTCT